MDQYKGKLTKAERRLVRRVIIAAVIVGALWILFAPNRGLLHYRKIQRDVDTLAQENLLLEQRNKELQQEIERLKTDEAMLEELARHKFGLLKENETIYEVK